MLFLKPNPDLNWNSYILAIIKDAGTMVDSLYCSNSRCYALSFQELDQRPRMAYCCHIWASNSQSSLFSRKVTEFKSIYAALWVINYFPTWNSDHTDETMLTSHYSVCYYFYGKCPNELHFLVASTQTCTTRTCHAKFTMANHPHYLQLLFQNSYFIKETPEMMLLWALC